MSENKTICKEVIIQDMDTFQNHQHVFIGWIRGLTVQYKTTDGRWVDLIDNKPYWSPQTEYRLKPQPPEEIFVNFVGQSSNRGSAWVNKQHAIVDADNCETFVAVKYVRADDVQND